MMDWYWSLSPITFSISFTSILQRTISLNIFEELYNTLFSFCNNDQGWHFEIWWLVTKIDTCISNIDNIG